MVLADCKSLGRFVLPVCMLPVAKSTRSHIYAARNAAKSSIVVAHRIKITGATASLAQLPLRASGKQTAQRLDCLRRHIRIGLSGQ